jgi:hypothetical protein
MVTELAPIRGIPAALHRAEKDLRLEKPVPRFGASIGR